MKKFIYILVMLLIISFVPNSAFADNNLIISNWTVDSILLENGDLSIVEDITFKFNDRFNGVFRDIVLEGTGGIKDFSLYEIVPGQEIEYKLSLDPKRGKYFGY